MTWFLVSSVIVVVAGTVLAVVLWRDRRQRNGSESRAALERAEAQAPEVERLVHDLRARRAKNNFAPLIEQALRRGS